MSFTVFTIFPYFSTLFLVTQTDNQKRVSEHARIHILYTYVILFDNRSDGGGPGQRQSDEAGAERPSRATNTENGH